LKSLDVEYVGEITKKKMIRPSYDTDLTDVQWQILEPLIPLAKTGGRNRTLDMREVLNAIFYLLANGWIVLLPEKNSWKK
jgi:putative transposase